MHMQGNTLNAFRRHAGARDLAAGRYERQLRHRARRRRCYAGADPTSHVINLEGTKVIDFPVAANATGSVRFKETTATVEVTDGFLTVDANGGVNTKIDYITVTPTPADQPPAKPAGLVATPGDASVALSWTANGETDLKGYNVYRGTTATVATTTPLNADADRRTRPPSPTPPRSTAPRTTTSSSPSTTADQASAASTAVSATPDPANPALAALPIKINFTAAARPQLAGYTTDTGLPFTNLAGRGWVEPGTHNPRNLSDNSRLRAARSGITQTDQQRGLVHMESADITGSFTGKTTGSYEFAVADGYYDVTVSVGDQPGATVAGTCPAPCYDSVHSIVVENRAGDHRFPGDRGQGVRGEDRQAGARHRRPADRRLRWRRQHQHQDQLPAHQPVRRDRPGGPGQSRCRRR